MKLESIISVAEKAEPHIDSLKLSKYFWNIKNEIKLLKKAEEVVSSDYSSDFEMFPLSERALRSFKSLNVSNKEILLEYINDKHNGKKRSFIGFDFYYLLDVESVLSKYNKDNGIADSDFTLAIQKKIIDCIFSEPKENLLIGYLLKSLRDDKSPAFIQELMLDGQEGEVAKKICEAEAAALKIDNIKRPVKGLACILIAEVMVGVLHHYGIEIVSFESAGLLSSIYPGIQFAKNFFKMGNLFVSDGVSSLINNTAQTVRNKIFHKSEVVDYATLYSTNGWNLDNIEDIKAAILSKFIVQKVKSEDVTIEFNCDKFDQFIKKEGLPIESSKIIAKFCSKLEKLNQKEAKELLELNSSNLRQSYLESLFNKKDFYYHTIKNIDLFMASGNIVDNNFKNDNNYNQIYEKVISKYLEEEKGIKVKSSTDLKIFTAMINHLNHKNQLSTKQKELMMGFWNEDGTLNQNKLNNYCSKYVVGKSNQVSFTKTFCNLSWNLVKFITPFLHCDTVVKKNKQFIEVSNKLEGIVMVQEDSFNFQRKKGIDNLEELREKFLTKKEQNSKMTI